MNYLLYPTYLGDLLHYTLLVNAECTIDCHSHYTKQCHINRTTILTAGGVQTLTIPVQKATAHTPISDIRISSHGDWQQLHIKAIRTAYNSSPFYEYFHNELFEYYLKPHTFLLDFNLEIQEIIVKMLDYDKSNITLSTEYINNDNFKFFDCRKMPLAEKFNVSLHRDLLQPYYQPHTQKFGFIPHLSILDALFNIGPETRILIKQLYNAINSEL